MENTYDYINEYIKVRKLLVDAETKFFEIDRNPSIKLGFTNYTLNDKKRAFYSNIEYEKLKPLEDIIATIDSKDIANTYIDLSVNDIISNFNIEAGDYMIDFFKFREEKLKNTTYDKLDAERQVNGPPSDLIKTALDSVNNSEIGIQKSFNEIDNNLELPELPELSGFVSTNEMLEKYLNEIKSMYTDAVYNDFKNSGDIIATPLTNFETLSISNYEEYFIFILHHLNNYDKLKKEFITLQERCIMSEIKYKYNNDVGNYMIEFFNFRDGKLSGKTLDDLDYIRKSNNDNFKNGDIVKAYGEVIMTYFNISTNLKFLKFKENYNPRDVDNFNDINKEIDTYLQKIKEMYNVYEDFQYTKNLNSNQDDINSVLNNYEAFFNFILNHLINYDNLKKDFITLQERFISGGVDNQVNYKILFYNQFLQRYIEKTSNYFNIYFSNTLSENIEIPVLDENTDFPVFGENLMNKYISWAYYLLNKETYDPAVTTASVKGDPTMVQIGTIGTIGTNVGRYDDDTIDNLDNVRRYYTAANDIYICAYSPNKILQECLQYYVEFAENNILL